MKADRLSRFLAMRSVSSSRFIEVMCLVILSPKIEPNIPNLHGKGHSLDRLTPDILLSIIPIQTPHPHTQRNESVSFNHRPQLVTDSAPGDEALLRLNLEDALEAVAV